MSDDRRWGSFCSVHWENRRRRVWRSKILLCRDSMSCLMSAMREEKKSDVNEAEPTGWPRRRKPEVSSIGRGDADLSVGWGAVENRAMEVDREAARVGS